MLRATLRVGLVFLPFLVAAVAFSLLEPAAPPPEPRPVASVETLSGNVRQLARQVSRHKNEEFRSAIAQILTEQILFCDGKKQPDRVTMQSEPSDDGSTKYSFYSPGRHGHEDRLPAAITTRSGNVVGMSFAVISNIDSCPCETTEYPTYVDDEFLQLVANIQTLEQLDLQHSKLTDTGLSALRRLRHLKFVDLSNTSVTPAGLQQLQGSSIEELLLNGVNRNWDSEELFNVLAGFPMLSSLQIQNIQLTAASIERLRSLPSLKTLSLTGEFSGGRNERLVVADILRLESISLQLFGDFGSIRIRDLPKLQTFSSRTVRTTAPDERDEFARLPELTSLHCSARGGNAPRLSELPKLETISFAYLAGLPEIPAPLPTVKDVSSYSMRAPGTFFRCLDSFPQLERLHVSPHHKKELMEPIAMADLAPIAGLKQLKDLRLSQLTTVDFSFFESITSLERIMLRKVRLPNVVVFSHPRLKLLRVDSDDTVESVSIESMPNIDELEISCGRVPTASFRNVPKLQRFALVSQRTGPHIDFSESGIADWSRVHIRVSRNSTVVPPNDAAAETNEPH